MKNVSWFFFVIFFLINSSAIGQIDLSQTELQTFQKNSSQGYYESNDLFDYNVSPTSILLQDQRDILKNQSNYNFQILEKPIDENVYTLGPNDEISIFVWGTLNKALRVTINSEGLLLIPSVGIVDLNGLTLAQGKEKIKALGSKIYKNAEITISLSKLRVFPVYITGEVKNPGVYLVNNQTRVLELINNAGGFTKKESARLRGIEISNDVYPIRYADVSQILHGSKNDKNIYLLQGDRVSISPRNEIVAINGNVNYSGVYDHVKGDCLGDILKAAGGLSRGADSSRIQLTRFKDNKELLEVISLRIADTLFEVMSDDRILVSGLPEYRNHYQVTIEGAVQWPGVYPINRGKTRLNEILKASGGFTDDVDLHASRIIRGGFQNNRELLKTLPVDQLTSIEQSFFKSQIIEDGNVVHLDFSDSSDTSVSNLILEHSDRIIIKQRNQSVRVSGGVNFPGIMEYKPSENYMYYVNNAGGFKSGARKRNVKIIRNHQVGLLNPQDIKSIYSGDVIVVPEITNSQIVKDIINVVTILSASVSIIGTIVVLTRN